MISFSELSILKNVLGFTELECEVKTIWGTQSDSNAEFKKTTQKLIEDKGSNAFFLSRSHAPDCGGYLSIQSEAVRGVGFDIELTARVTPKIAKRISHNQLEADRACSPPSLWVAKEATFKALINNGQPQVLSQIEIGEWKKFSHYETFKLLSVLGSKSLKGRGCVLKRGKYSLGFFVCLS